MGVRTGNLRALALALLLSAAAVTVAISPAGSVPPESWADLGLSAPSIYPPGAAPINPYADGNFPDWMLNGEPMPIPETARPHRPGDVVIDEITPVDEALAEAALNQVPLQTVSADEFDWLAAPSVAESVGISEAEALLG